MCVSRYVPQGPGCMRVILCTIVVSTLFSPYPPLASLVPCLSSYLSCGERYSAVQKSVVLHSLFVEVDNCLLFPPSLQVHPIFVISVADCFLGISWVLGGAFWIDRIEDRSWCYLSSLLNVVPPFPFSLSSLSSSFLQILQCVSVNLTVVYALLAYSIIRKQDLSSAVLVRSSLPVPCPCN